VAATSRLRSMDEQRSFLDSLPDSVELTRLRDAHRDHFLGRLREVFDEGQTTENTDAYVAFLEAEAQNVRAAVAWSIRRNHSAALQFIPLLNDWWQSRGDIGHAATVVDAALALSDMPELDRLEALTTAAYLFTVFGDNARAFRFAEEATAIAKRSGSRAQVARALRTLGWAQFSSFSEDAVDTFREASEHEEDSAAWLQADILRGLGWAERNRGDHGAALERHEEALSLLRAAGDQAALANHLIVHANIHHETGDLDAAAAFYTEAVDLLASLGDGQVGVAQAYLAQVEFERSNLDAAVRRLDAALAMTPPTWLRDRVYMFRQRARLALNMGDLAAAAEAVTDGRSSLDAIEDPTPNDTASAMDLRLLEAEVAIETAEPDRARLSIATFLGSEVLDGSLAFRVLHAAARLADHLGDRTRAATLLDRALERLGDATGWAYAVVSRHRIVADRRALDLEFTDAATAAREALDATRERVPRLVTPCAIALVECLLAMGDVASARRVADEGVGQHEWNDALAAVAAAEGDLVALRVILRSCRDRERPTRRIRYLELLAEAAVRTGAQALGAQLRAASASERERLGVGVRCLDEPRLAMIDRALAAFSADAARVEGPDAGATLEAALEPSS